MCRKLMFLISFVCVLVLSGSAFAESGPEADLWVHPGDSCSISGTVTLEKGFYVDVGATLTITGTLTCKGDPDGDGYRPTINGGTLIVDGGNLNLPVRLNIGQDAPAGPQGGTVYVINDGNMVQWDGGGKNSDEGIKFPDDSPPEGPVASRIFVLDGTLDAVLIEQKTAYDAKFIVGCNGTITVGETDNGWEYDPDRWLANGDLNCDPGCPGFIVITPLFGDVKQVICLQAPVATDPEPADGAPGECPSGLVLSWTPTDQIADPNHDVYLDSNSNDVAQATRASHDDVQYYSQNQEDPNYTVPGTLQVNTTYYWRVDEVNNADPCVVWQTPVIWSFTIEDGNAFGPAPADGLRGWNPALPLTWTPSCAATAQAVYFSTDFNDVNELKPAGLYDSLDPTDNNIAPALDPFTRYYWRVVTTGGGDAEVWTFKTGYGGLLLEMLFEGTPDTNLPATESDTSGNGLHFTTFSAAHHPDADGSVKYAADVAVGTSAAFEPEAGLYRPDPAGPSGSDYLRLDGHQFSIHLWVKPADLSEDDSQRLLGKSGWTLEIHDPGRGDEANNNYRFDRPGSEVSTLDDTAIEDEWIHIAVVYDQPDLSIYLNGVRVRYEESPDPVPDNNNPVGIGCSVSQQVDGNYPCNDFFDGSIDEVKIWDTVVVPVFGNSSNPSPPHRARRLDPCDPNNTVLTWTPGPYADHHDVYFGTNANVVLQDTVDGNMYPEVGNLALDYGKTYYWRVDDVNDGDSKTYKGFLWRFTMDSDSNLVVWYKFDELEDGDTVMDSSGNDLHGDADGDDDDTWDPNDGRFPGCINFQEETRVDLDPDVLLYDYIGDSISISVWWKDAWRDNENYFCAFGDDDLHMVVRAPDDDGNPGVIWQAGNDTNDLLEWTTNARAWKDDWHHLVFTKNGPEGTMKIYFDTFLVADTNDAKGDTLSQAVLRAITGDEDGFRIGADWDSDNDFRGKADDFRVYDCEISQSEIDELFRGDDLGYAWAPTPYDGQIDVPYDVNLSWMPGNYIQDVNGHEVFFGTDWDDVNDVNSSNYASYPNVDYNNTDACSYDPNGFLTLGQLYYWRVDEVNDACDPNGWRGNIWQFTVADYIGIDDMEKYTESWTDYPISYWSGSWGWDCGFNNDTGSTLGLGLPEQGRPVRGKQSMEYVYDNTGTFYSEVSNHFPMDPCDWTYADVKMLTLWFYGDTDNAANETEQMYVGLEDSDGNYAEVRYPLVDMSDIKIKEWQEWNIALSDFNDDNPDLTLTNIEKLYIGFGDRNGSENGGGGFVYFDDIRLYPPTCVPSQRPEAFAKIDFNNDCIVDFGDVKIMAEQWLDSDVNLGEVSEPCDANLVGWWMLDEGSGSSTAHDSSDYHNDGTLQILDVNVSWVAGRNDVNCALEFDGGRVRVPNAQSLMPMHQVSACAWVYYSEGQDHSARIVVKGADDKETYDLEVSDKDELVFNVRDGNDPNAEKYPKYDAKSSEGALGHGEWIHIAGTYDGNSVKCYINGEVAGVNNDANAMTYFGHPLSQDTNDLAIGNQPDDTDGGFEGTIDDVRVYNYGLSAAEVAYLATDGGQNGVGIFRMQSVANLYTEEPLGSGVINLRDFAKMAGVWLEEELWP